MAQFQRAYTITAKEEGGYVNHPNDKGGETYKGIARTYHPNWPGWIYLDREKENRRLRNKNIKEGKEIGHNEKLSDPNLAREVDNFIKQKFWDKIKGDQILDQDVATLMFDMVINHGQGVRLIQKALANLGVPIRIDNKYGSNTLNAINNYFDPNNLYNELLKVRQLYYLELIENNSKNKAFEKGWLNRVLNFKILKQNNILKQNIHMQSQPRPNNFA